MKRTSQFRPQTTNFNCNTHDILEHILTFLKYVTKHTKIHRCTQWPKNKINPFVLVYSIPSWKVIICWILIFRQKLITNRLCGFEVGKFLLHFHSILDSNLTQAPRTNGQPEWTSIIFLSLWANVRIISQTRLQVHPYTAFTIHNPSTFILQVHT